MTPLARLRATNFLKRLAKDGYAIALDNDTLTIPDMPPDLRAQVDGQADALKELLQKPAWDAAAADRVITACLASIAVAGEPESLASRALRWECFDRIDECTSNKDLGGLREAAAKLAKLLELERLAVRM